MKPTKKYKKNTMLLVIVFVVGTLANNNNERIYKFVVSFTANGKQNIALMHHRSLRTGKKRNRIFYATHTKNGIIWTTKKSFKKGSFDNLYIQKKKFSECFINI